MWVNNNKQKIINKLKEENFNVLINIFKTDLSIFSQIFKVLETFFTFKY